MEYKFVMGMSVKSRRHLESALEGVAHRNRMRAEARDFYRKRRRLLEALRKGRVKTLEDGTVLLGRLGLPARPRIGGPFGVNTIETPGCPMMIFSLSGEYIGKDFQRRDALRPSTERPGQEELFMPDGELGEP